MYSIYWYNYNSLIIIYSLLAVNPTAYTRGTVALLVALHDNYNADVAVAETETAAETAEINAFLDAVLATPIMQQLQTFLTSKGISLTREKFHEMWFGLYSRSGSTLGSSGLEHIFLAELKNGVSGFHNWVFKTQILSEKYSKI